MDLQFNCDGWLAEVRRVFYDLKKSRVPVEEVACRPELLCANVWTYDDRFKADFRKGFAAFLNKLQNATKHLVKKHDLGIEESVDVNIAVVDAILEALKTELSHAGLSLYPDA